MCTAYHSLVVFSGNRLKGAPETSEVESFGGRGRAEIMEEPAGVRWVSAPAAVKIVRILHGASLSHRFHSATNLVGHARDDHPRSSVVQWSRMSNGSAKSASLARAAAMVCRTLAVN